jgi:hypothetical protein
VFAKKLIFKYLHEHFIVFIVRLQL